MNIRVDVENDHEMNQVISQYLGQGYKIESNFGNNVVLKKKGYNLVLLIILLLLGIIFGIIYYLVCDDDIVTIYNKSGDSYNNVGNIQNNPQQNTQAFKSFCVNCGTGLKDGDKFCPNCGKEVNTSIEHKEVPRISE